MTELWRTLVETGAVEVDGRRDPAHAPARRASAPRRACARSSASGWRGSTPATTELLELAAIVGHGLRARRPRARAAASRSRSCSRRSTRRSAAGMIEEVSAPAARVPLHARAGAPGALRPAQRAAPRGAPPPGRRGARERPANRSGCSPTSPTTSRRPPRSAAITRGVDYNVARRPRRAGRARLRRGRGPASAPRSSSGSTTPPERAGVYLELGTACHRAGSAHDALEAFTAAAEIARELGDAELLAPRGDRLRGRLLAPRDHRPSRRSELLEEAVAVLGDESSDAAGAPARRPGPRARLPG